MAVYDEKAGVNEKMKVFTPELWQFVCLNFGRDAHTRYLEYRELWG